MLSFKQYTITTLGDDKIEKNKTHEISNLAVPSEEAVRSCLSFFDHVMSYTIP